MTSQFLPRLPEKWDAVPLKYSCSLNPEVLPETTAPDTDIQYVDIAALDGGHAELASQTIAFGEAPSRARRVLRSGDTILSTVRTYLKAVATFPDVSGNLIASTGFAVLRSNGRLHPRFGYWAVLSEPFIEGVVAHSDGVSYPAINPTVLGSLKVPVPSLAEQERIARFLDEQTARIDALIAEKEQLSVQVLEFADAETTAVLTGAKSESWDFKKTGWRFMPKIPSHWEACHLRWISRRVDVGIAEAATHAYADEGVPILRSTNIRPNSIEGNLIYIQLWFAEKNRSKTLFTDDLVTVRTGYPGVTAVVPESLDGCQCFTMLMTTLMEGYLPEFYARYLNSAPARGYFEVEAWGSAQNNISVPILKDIVVPRLPLDEQKAIAKQCRDIDSASRQLTAHLASHIDRLHEYRSSLISAAVTGQLDINSFKAAA